MSNLTKLGSPNINMFHSGFETQFMADNLLNFVGIHQFAVFA